MWSSADRICRDDARSVVLNSRCAASGVKQPLLLVSVRSQRFHVSDCAERKLACLWRCGQTWSMDPRAVGEQNLDVDDAPVQRIRRRELETGDVGPALGSCADPASNDHLVVGHDDCGRNIMMISTMPTSAISDKGSSEPA
jgi:hypothetical protein